MSVLGVSDLIARKQKAITQKTIHVKELGGEVVVKQLTAKRYAELIDSADLSTTAGSIAGEQQLIYESCPVFQSRELQEAYSVTIPEDVVSAVLFQNIEAMHAITAEITEMYTGMKDELKN